MTSAASFAAPLMRSGVLQIVCGVVILLIDVIGLAAYGFSVPFLYLGIVLGVFYIITGALTTATSSAFRKGSGNGHGLAIGSLVMSILSILSSISIAIWAGFTVAGIQYLTVNDCSSISVPESRNICANVVTFGQGLWGADMVFLVIMFITSIVACIYISRGLASNRTTRTTYATRVA